MRYQMPKIDVAEVEVHGEQESAILAAIMNGECLRASKPPIRRGEDSEYTDRCAAYVWRMAVFTLSPNPRHHCMPMCADMDLPRDEVPGFDEPGHYEALWAAREKRQQLIRDLDDLANRIIGTVPASEWHGTRRWGQALGVIGTPRVAPNGSIIYR